MPKFEKGKSGNPLGRPRGIPDRRSRLRALLETEAEALVASAIKMAKAGDSGALRLCLERLIPALRPRDEPLTLPIPEDARLGAFGQMLLNELSTGRITPDEASKLLGGLSNLARVVEMSELESRIKQLEDTNAKHTKAT